MYLKESQFSGLKLVTGLEEPPALMSIAIDKKILLGRTQFKVDFANKNSQEPIITF